MISLARVEKALLEAAKAEIPNFDDISYYLKIQPGDEINVKAKDTRVNEEDKKQLWYGESNGKHGYFPKTIVREIRVYTDDLKYTVPSDVSFFF